MLSLKKTHGCSTICLWFPTSLQSMRSAPQVCEWQMECWGAKTRHVQPAPSHSLGVKWVRRHAGSDSAKNDRQTKDPSNRRQHYHTHTHTHNNIWNLSHSMASRCIPLKTRVLRARGWKETKYIYSSTVLKYNFVAVIFLLANFHFGRRILHHISSR